MAACSMNATSTSFSAEWSLVGLPVTCSLTGMTIRNLRARIGLRGRTEFLILEW